MAQQIISLGATGSGAGGDSARTAFEKAIANFAELYIAALPGTAAQKQAAREMFGAENASNLTSGTLPDARVSSTLTADKAFRRGNILGTVSQAGGVPAGAIIERGSNANGEYIKWADGTLECWQRSVTVDCVADTDLDVAWPLPAAFNAVNAAVTCTLRSPAVTNNFIVHKLQGNHTSAAACTMRVRFSVTQSYLLTFHAIGRWY